MLKKTNKSSYLQNKMKINSLIIIALLYFILLSVAFYINYIDNQGPVEVLNVSFDKSFSSQTSLIIPQLYPNMKFNHNNISYEIDSFCSQEKKSRIMDAFNELTNKIGFIYFYESFNDSDIEIYCINSTETNLSRIGIQNQFKIKHTTKTIGEGGATDIISTGRYNIINKGIVIFYDFSYNFCKYSNIELHELIHVFGFDHSHDPNDIMYRTVKSCDQKLNETLLKELKKLYSEENLSDLYFENITAVKKGRYLDLNITVKNSGVVNIKNFSLGIFDNGKLIEEKKFGELEYGSGMFIEIKNIRLKHKNPEEIRFWLDYKNLTKEIDEENNIARVITYNKYS